MTTLATDLRHITNLTVPSIMARQPLGGILQDEPPDAEEHLARMANLPHEEWPAYMLEAGLPQAEIANAAKLVNDWLDTANMESLSEIAQQAHQSGQRLSWIMDAWCQTAPYRAIEELIAQQPFSQPDLVTCYAVATATELALAERIMLKIAASHDYSCDENDAEHAEDDEFIASLNLKEDMLNWPE